MIQFEGPPLETFELEKESPPPEPSQGGDGLVSPSSDSEDDTASSSSEESLSEGHSTEVPAKRDEWVESSEGGVGEEKGGADGFKPAPLGKRACRRLAKSNRQRETETARLEQQKLEAQRAREDLALQREALAAAAKERQDKVAKGPAEGTRQLGGRGRGRGAGRGRAPTQTQRGVGGRGQGLARRPDRIGSSETEDELAPGLYAKVGMVKYEVACGKCGIIKHPQRPVRMGVRGELVFTKCPLRGCHVCCRRGERGGGRCTIQGGRAFFEKMLRESCTPPYKGWIEDRWQSWRTQLGL